jgi:hypothetical protein
MQNRRNFKVKRNSISQLQKTIQDFKNTQTEVKALHGRVEEAINKSFNAEKTDTNYIFLYFVKNTLPVGMIRLLFAVISGQLGFHFGGAEFPCCLLIKRCSSDI